MKRLIKAGKLANGFERGKGQVVHLVPDGASYCGNAVCGSRPAVQWTDAGHALVTCKKCLEFEKRAEKWAPELFEQLARILNLSRLQCKNPDCSCVQCNEVREARVLLAHVKGD